MSPEEPGASWTADVVIVGSGIAGLVTALALEGVSILLVTKGRLGLSGSTWRAQGGIAAACDPDDTPELHMADTLRVGCGLCDPERVRILTTEGPRRLEQLLAWGVPFDRDEQGRLRLGREGAHSRRRIVHARGDTTGAVVVRHLRRKLAGQAKLRVLEETEALELAVTGGGVRGVWVRRTGETAYIEARRGVVLATGGIGGLYRWTTNPASSVGDGLAMAARAGAVLADLEFVQFHPTALAVGRSPLPLLTEALRGEGALLVDSNGCRFMPDEHPAAELAPRDVVARAIWKRRRQGLDVFLDARRTVGETFPHRFPNVYRLCLQHGLDPRRELLPVTPAAHYHVGGIATDEWGRTSLPGLWACGEVAATGVHGANRLASNSLLEGLVFAFRVAEDLRGREARRIGGAERTAPPPAPRRAAAESRLKRKIRDLMWDRVGLLRSGPEIQEALEQLERWRERYAAGSPALGNMLLSASLICRAALAREESRGVHYRTDFPAERPEFGGRLFLRGDEVRLEAPVPR
ncbi:MAG: L-aspartate oxidase [Acidobacteriota bacterium]